MHSDKIKLNENQIKSLFLEKLRRDRYISKKTFIASEYVLGRNKARIDLAYYNGVFTGIEIKSALDSLDRLRDQLDTYGKCFDKVLLIVSEKHFPVIFEKIPEWVDLYKVEDLNIELVYEAREPHFLEKNKLLKILSNEDLRKIICSPKKRVQNSRAYLLERAIELEEEKIRDTVICVFKNKFSTTSQKFWREVGRKRINPHHLKYLSPYMTERARMQREKIRHTAGWDAWLEEAKRVFDTH